MSSTNGCEENPRYVSADHGSAKPLERELPLLPLIGREDSLTFTNPLINGGATGETRNESGATYETLPEPGKVLNPMYEMMDNVKGKREEKQQVALSQYEDVDQVKKALRCEDEYITMQPTHPTKPNGDIPA